MSISYIQYLTLLMSIASQQFVLAVTLAVNTEIIASCSYIVYVCLFKLLVGQSAIPAESI